MSLIRANFPSGFEVMVDGGWTPCGIDAVVWAKQVEGVECTPIKSELITGEPELVDP